MDMHSRPAGEISTGEILRALEGSISTLCKRWKMRKRQQMQAYVWKKLKAAIDDVVDNVT